METPTDQRPSPRRPLWGALFCLHAAVLTTGLLWPHLQVPGVIPRPDLVVHCLAFGPFCLLLCLWNPLRLRSAWKAAALAVAIGAAYGATTELLQSIPILRRTAALDDWLADVVGLVCGATAFGCLKMWWPAGWPRGGRRADT